MCFNPDNNNINNIKTRERVEYLRNLNIPASAYVYIHVQYFSQVFHVQSAVLKVNSREPGVAWRSTDRRITGLSREFQNKKHFSIIPDY